MVTDTNAHVRIKLGRGAKGDRHKITYCDAVNYAIAITSIAQQKAFFPHLPIEVYFNTLLKSAFLISNLNLRTIEVR
jgi:hypothetical protein